MKTGIFSKKKKIEYAALDKERIYTEYYTKVKGYVMSKVSSQSDIDDIVSNVFLKVYSNLENFDPEKASVSTWIYTISRNTVMDYFRERGNYLTVVDGDAELEDVDCPDDAVSTLLNNEMLEKLADALGKLEERERDIVILHDYKNVSLAAIAEKKSMSYSNIKIVHNKALEKLRKYLEKYMQS